MKNQILHIAAVTVLILGLVSCNKFDDQTNENSNNSNTPNTLVDTTTTDPVSQGEWIDLGLPSGLLWYSVNLGASSPSVVGDKYAWGETWTKTTFNWSTYIYGSRDNITKYNTDDGLTTLEAGDDAATVIIGDGARIPTKNEWQEMIDNTRVDWTSLNGVYGRMFTSITNGKSLFLPSIDNYLYGDKRGYYWTASRSGTRYNAYYFLFNNDSQYFSEQERCQGFSIRAVRSAQ